MPAVSRNQRFSFAFAAASTTRLVGLVALWGIAFDVQQVFADVDFNRDVRPILSDKCYFCHGPDPETREADLRLDQREGLFAEKEGRTPAVPGKPDASEIIRRITSTDPDEIMPPPSANRALTQAQKETLRQWITDGAKWNQHWSFSAITNPAPPEVPRGWAKSEIDQFVLAPLKAKGATPNAEADRARLLRRVSFDLTGLPPTVAEIDEFLNDQSPTAYEKVVDRLLASSRYGERVASEWLDVARFADTHGFQADRYRAMWPYRDWVIGAFNRNQPIDEFIIWQIAGDLLPSATREQQLATAFNRLHMQNEEGGIVAEEFRVAYVVDRVDTFGTAFLGLTLECCRCHDHKYDPLTQKDFYSLFAFFQNIDESGQTSYFTDAMPVPALMLPSEQQSVQISELAAKVTTAEKHVARARESARADFDAWLAVRPEEPDLPGLIGDFTFEDIRKRRLENRADEKTPGKVIERPKRIKGANGYGAQLDGENGFDFPGIGHFTKSEPFSFSLWVRPTQQLSRGVIFHHSKAPVDAGSRGYELLLEEGRLAFGLHHMWPENSLKAQTKESLPLKRWSHVCITYDGSSQASGVVVYIDGSRMETEIVRDGLHKDITYSGKEPDLAMGHRFRDNGFKGGGVDEFKVFNRRLTALEVNHLAGDEDLEDALVADVAELSPEVRESLFDYFLAAYCPKYQSALHDLAAARKAHSQEVHSIPEVMVMRELDKAKSAFLLKRGSYDALGEAVQANTPAALPPMPANALRNRLGLAQWVTDPEHPLTSRVIVNRAWQMMFGRGIVETSENFGTQGTPPSHPELLDWLARDFISHGWDYKRLIRQIALSATYRQSSIVSLDALHLDPANEWLSRGPARRLSAEMLRDQALSLGGLLVEKIGGPSVKPYQPDGLWALAAGNLKYEQGRGEDLYRRSLYTFCKRTVPHPAMVALDSADRSTCSVRRQSTSTPLQALTLLNDPQQTEAARFIAERVLREADSDDAKRLAFAFRLITGRAATTAELNVLEKMRAEQLARFQADPAAADALLHVGEAARDAALPARELATYTVIATALLNHDEALMKR
jgi:hypothetical protein